MNDPLPAAALQIFFIVLTALCTGAEAAICCVNDYKMRSLAKEGNKKAQRVIKLMEDEAKVVSGVQTGIMAFTVAVGALGGCVYVPLLANAITSMGLSVFLVALCEIIIIVVLGDMIPKKICTSRPDECAMMLSGVINAVWRVLYPISFVLNFLSKAIVSMSGNDPDGEVENVTEDEIRMMVDLGSEKGTIAPEEKELIKNIFEFGDISAEDVMTHRKDVAVLMKDDTPKEWEETVRESGYSRFPVCGEDIDDIVGVVYARELYEFFYDKESDVENIIHQAYIVPETLSIDVLFKNMQKEKTHFAVVADEYGGFSGIVTMDDILSEIVGEIEDEEYDEEFEDESEDIVKLSDNTWEIDGMAQLDEISQALGVELPVDEFDTLSGLVLDCIDYIPDDGATVDVETCGLEIQAVQIKDRRIVRAIVKKIED